MKKQNVVLFDSNEKEAAEYIQGLCSETKSEWKLVIETANKGRESRFYNVTRYTKYFLFPLKIFFDRKKYNVIIGWQAFYGILFAFYCRLFHVTKRNKLVIQHFIYKKKGGILGRIYDWFVHFAVSSEYVDLIVTCSSQYVDTLKKEFHLKDSQVAFARFGVNDFTKWVENNDLEEKNFVLSVGRSNRDWDFLIESLAGQPFKVIICCDELHRSNLADNIIIKNDVNGIEAFKYMQNCKCAVIPIKNGELSAGETVLLQQMCFGKTIIITRPSSLANDYIKNGENGIVIEKKQNELQEAVNTIFEDDKYCSMLSGNARRDFVSQYSLFTHGKAVGAILSEHKIIV